MQYLLVAALVAAAVGVLLLALIIWASFSLFRGVNNATIDLVPQGPSRALEALKLDYEVAQELGYSEEDLAGLKEQIILAEAEEQEPYAELDIPAVPARIPQSRPAIASR